VNEELGLLTPKSTTPTEKGGRQMKMQKGLVGCAGFVMVLVLLVAVPAHGQVSWESWVGQWFQGTIMDKGVMVNESWTDQATDKANAYGYVSSLDGDEYTFLLFKLNPDTRDWIGPIPYVAKVVGGTPLNYVTYGFIPPGPGREAGIELFALIMNITGKEKKGELTSPSATAIAGCVIYINPAGGYFAANETLTFKSAKKVPDELLGRIAR
jgi:hypothetical protein